MDYSWINTSWSAVLMVIISTVGIYIALIAYTRMAGLRSFSKMSSFDFAITIAIGSTIGSIITTKSPPLLLGMVAIGVVYIMQMVVSYLRDNSNIVRSAVDNDPLLLMDGSTFNERNLNKAKVTRSDLYSKLREANVTQMSQIKAVVMETTGDIAVLHSEDSDKEIDDIILKDVRGWD